MEEALFMSSESTKAVLDHHGAALLAGDIDAVMEDYTDDSVFISNLGGVLKGLRAIRSVFETTREFGGFMETTMHIDGDVAFATWTAEGISFGSDTFVIREGKIVRQTVAIALA
jgi:ketosteroid isomerase-like protein